MMRKRNRTSPHLSTNEYKEMIKNRKQFDYLYSDKKMRKKAITGYIIALHIEHSQVFVDRLRNPMTKQFFSMDEYMRFNPDSKDFDILSSLGDLCVSFPCSHHDKVFTSQVNKIRAKIMDYHKNTHVGEEFVIQPSD